ncbi:hypothetical protein LCGC14_2483910, partial [marine sediment metagenome]
KIVSAQENTLTDKETLFFVASCPSIQKTLSELSKNVNIDIRAAVASNPQTSEATLADLSDDTDTKVKSSVASNSNTPVDILEKLVNELSPSILWAICTNINISDYCFNVLSECNCDKEYENILVMVAQHSQCPLEVLTKLLKIDKVRINGALAQNPNTPEEMLITLSMHNNWWIRRCIVNNPSTSKEILQKLSKDHSTIVSKTAQEKLKVYEKVDVYWIKCIIKKVTNFLWN